MNIIGQRIWKHLLDEFVYDENTSVKTDFGLDCIIYHHDLDGSQVG